MFGYKYDELVGHNVKRIVPREIERHHNQFIKSYFATGQTKLMDKQHPLFAVNKEGYIFPIIILIKMYPSLMKRLLFVGLIQRVEQFDAMEELPQSEFLLN